MINLSYLYLLSPLHTGGTVQEGNLLGIARESHTNLPYIPSSSIRGRLRASVVNQTLKFRLFGNEIAEGEQLEQGDIWIGDGSLLWVPVPSLSHGVIWVSSPLLLQRWIRASRKQLSVPAPYSSTVSSGRPVYLKDAILKASDIKAWGNGADYVPQHPAGTPENLLVLPDQHAATLIEASLWRQVKVKLNEHKVVDGGFRYEEAIPPDSILWFSWGTTSQAKRAEESRLDFAELLQELDILQIGGQESLGRGFVQTWNGKE